MRDVVTALRLRRQPVPVSMDVLYGVIGASMRVIDAHPRDDEREKLWWALNGVRRLIVDQVRRSRAAIERELDSDPDDDGGDDSDLNMDDVEVDLSQLDQDDSQLF